MKRVCSKRYRGAKWASSNMSTLTLRRDHRTRAMERERGKAVNHINLHHKWARESARALNLKVTVETHCA